MGAGSVSDSDAHFSGAVWTSAFASEASSILSTMSPFSEPETSHNTGVIEEKCVEHIHAYRSNSQGQYRAEWYGDFAGSEKTG